MWAVNPKRADLDWVPCVPTIADLPKRRMRFISPSRLRAVVAALRELAAMGVGGVVCFSAGFKETGDAAAEQALIEAALVTWP